MGLHQALVQRVQLLQPGGAGGTDELATVVDLLHVPASKKRAKVGGDGTLITLKERIAADEEEEPQIAPTVRGRT